MFESDGKKEGASGSVERRMHSRRKRENGPHLIQKAAFFFYFRHICYHKPALWETGAVISLFPGPLTFREALIATTLLWFISTSLRGIIPYHKPP